MLKTISEGSFGKYSCGYYSTDLCDPTPIPDKNKLEVKEFETATDFSPTVQTTMPTKLLQQLNTLLYIRIGLYVAGWIICLGLRSLISLLESSLIIKDISKLRTLKLLAENMKLFLAIYLVFCAICELLFYLYFDEFIKSLLSKLM